MPDNFDIAVHSAQISRKTIWTFVSVRDGEGRCGWGEATLNVEAPAVHREVERIGAALAGQSLQSALEFAPALANRIAGRPEAAAISALDQALWDLAAQTRGQ